jgi:hypothetical protein
MGTTYDREIGRTGKRLIQLTAATESVAVPRSSCATVVGVGLAANLRSK